MKDRNSLLRFLGGLALVSVGLFLLLNRVHVGSGGWGGWGRLSFGSFSVPSGLVVVPFIIGVIWMFGSEGSLASKIFTGITVLLIIAAVIMNTTFWVDRMTMFDWILILVMIFGGGTIVVTMLFNERGKAEREELEKYKEEAKAESEKAKALEKELESLKKNMSDKGNA